MASLFFTVASVRVRGSDTHSAETTVLVEYVQVFPRASSVFWGLLIHLGRPVVGGTRRPNRRQPGGESRRH